MNITEALHDPALGAVPVTVRRTCREPDGSGGSAVRSRTDTELTACVHPVREAAYLRSPETVLTRAVHVYTSYMLSAGTAPDPDGRFFTPDELIIGGRVFRVTDVETYPCCVRATAEYEREDAA